MTDSPQDDDRTEWERRYDKSVDAQHAKEDISTSQFVFAWIAGGAFVSIVLALASGIAAYAFVLIVAVAAIAFGVARRRRRPRR